MHQATIEVAGDRADSPNDMALETESVCELFAGDRRSEVFEYLKRHSESPLQVPFYFLKLVQMGRVAGDVAQSGKPAAEQVELAYRAILQRSPEDGAVVEHQMKMCDHLGQLIARLLSGPEAILRMPRLFARAFPMMRRLWHVHIPKTAGSSFFSAAVASGWGYVSTNGLTRAEGDLRRVAAAVRVGPGGRGSAIISGHWHLPQHADCIGPFDRVVVFVRDPVECLISEFNYAVDLVNRSSNVHAADPTPFLERGLDSESFLNTYERGFFIFNVQCSYLSREPTCAAALQNLEACNAELLPSNAVNHAVSRFFPGALQRRVNVSNKHVRSVEIDGALREKLLVKSQHDFLLHKIARMRYGRHQGTAESEPPTGIPSPAA